MFKQTNVLPQNLLNMEHLGKYTFFKDTVYHAGRAIYHKTKYADCQNYFQLQ